MKGIIAGVAGGIAGAILWGVIAAVTGFEIGWIAWGIGALVGAGVAWGSDGGPVPGVIAVIIAILSIIGGKMIAVEMVVNKTVTRATAHLDQRLQDDEEFVISCIADTMIEEMEQKGQTVHWPGGDRPAYPDSRTDYPQDVWTQAAQTWNAKDQYEQDDYRQELRQQIIDDMNSAAANVKAPGLLASFGAIDAIFFILAVATAYKIGARS